MKKLLISISLISYSTFSLAGTADFYNPLQYVPASGLNRAMNYVSYAGQRMGQAITSTASVVARANLGRAVASMSAVARGPIGLVATVAVGALLTSDTDKLTANPDGSFTYENTTTTTTTPSSAIVLGNMTWRNSGNVSTAWLGGVAGTYYWTQSPDVFKSAYKSNHPTYSSSTFAWGACRTQTVSSTRNTYSCFIVKASTNEFVADIWLAEQVPSLVQCAEGMDYKGGTGCVDNGTKKTISNTTTKTVSAQELPTAIPPSVLDKPLTPDQTAGLMNGVLAGARAQGISTPYPEVQPSDIPPNQPSTLRDFVDPVPTSQTMPTTNPTTSPTTNATPTTTTLPTNADGTIDQTKEADPGIGAPSLDLESPTANQILNPFLNLLPGFSNMTISGPGGSCSTNSFVIYGHSYNLNSFCDMLGANASTIQTAMRVFFTLMSIIIILGA